MFCFAFIVFLLLIGWVFEVFSPTKTSGKRQSDQQTQPGNVWIDSTFKAFTIRLRSHERSELFDLIVAREARLSMLQRYVQIGDLVHYPNLGKHITSFVTTVQDFDFNMRLLETEYDTTIAYLQAFASHFSIEFASLNSAKGKVTTQTNLRRRRANQGQTTQALFERHQTNTQVRELRTRFSVLAVSIVQAIGSLFEDTVTELEDFCATHHKSTNPLFVTHNNNTNQTTPATNPTSALTDLSLPQTHPLHDKISESLANISGTHRTCEDAMKSMREDLYDIDDTLRHFVDEIKHLRVDNIETRSQQLAKIMQKLDGIISRAR